MRREYKTLGFRCNDLEMCDRIAGAAEESGLSVSKYIEQTVINAVDGNVPNIARIEKIKIDMMREVQTIKDKHPLEDVSGLERIGDLL